ncbi:YheC/YheD family protein [Paenibacillus motobuensis]|uniref:Spore coat associated protein YheD n=1 Tax=Paenibacillus motobuensis TaxID=295324 RepID=A0ABN0Y759_9BACL
MSHLLADQKPVVAILTVHDKLKQFRGNRANFRDLVKIGRELDFPVYILTTKDLKLSAKKVHGYSYSPEEKTWKKLWFPLPNVIYNRIPLREDENKPQVRRIIDQCVKHHSIQLFNPYFFNKWRLFDWLKKNRSTRSLVPDTKRMRSPRTLLDMLKQYRSLYLKPESGKAGKGIMLLKYNPDSPKAYQLTIQGTRRKNVLYMTDNMASMWRRIRAETVRVPYIMQQGIPLTSYMDRHFDLRLLVQKTGKGVWSVTGVGARLAGPHRITTHVPQGGSVEDPDKLLTPTFGSDMTTFLINRLKSSALLIAKQVERGCGHTLGEMSMDLGIDTDGKIWFFEANAKPMKFDEPHIRRKSLERVFQFSNYLAHQDK